MHLKKNFDDLEVLKDIPSQTVVIFNVTGFEIAVKTDYKTGRSTIKDKNKKKDNKY